MASRLPGEYMLPIHCFEELKNSIPYYCHYYHYYQYYYYYYYYYYYHSISRTIPVVSPSCRSTDRGVG